MRARPPASRAAISRPCRLIWAKLARLHLAGRPRFTAGRKNSISTSVDVARGAPSACLATDQRPCAGGHTRDAGRRAKSTDWLRYMPIDSASGIWLRLELEPTGQLDQNGAICFRAQRPLKAGRQARGERPRPSCERHTPTDRKRAAALAYKPAG